MKVRSPSFSRKAWAVFLRRKGCTLREIASALDVSEFEAARLIGRSRLVNALPILPRRLMR